MCKGIHNTYQIVLLPASNSVSIGALKSQAPSQAVYACDFYIDGIEIIADEITGGFRHGTMVNIDHHAPVPCMSRQISSANLAIDHVRAYGLPGAGSAVVINHTDCDSVLSAAIISGMLPPDDEIGAAAIAADHTGTECPLADMLQGIQHLRDFGTSLRNARLLLDGMPLEAAAMAGLEERRRRREQAAQSLKGSEKSGGLAWLRLDTETDSELFPALMPDAALFLIAVPCSGDPRCHVMKLRLGLAAPEGFTLQHLNIREFDPLFGGRWNAGANKRGGGTDMAVEEYAGEISSRLQMFMTG